jgi:nucleotide-binding universal stress UspA family protein
LMKARRSAFSLQPLPKRLRASDDRSVRSIQPLESDITLGPFRSPGSDPDHATDHSAWVDRVALGTIARRLLARCSCPILTVPPEAESILSTAGCWRRVLVAIDFSAASLAALQCAHAIVRGQLLVLHASNAENEQERATCLEKLRFLAPLNESHTVPVEHIAATGDISTLISQQTLNFGPDLIVLGAPSSELSSEELNSSTVLEVISEAVCPVLCVPATETASSSRPLKDAVSV